MEINPTTNIQGDVPSTSKSMPEIAHEFAHVCANGVNLVERNRFSTRSISINRN